MYEEVRQYLTLMDKEKKLVKTRHALATLAAIYEGRHDKPAKVKKRVQYRMTQFHRDMLTTVALDAGIDESKALRRIINEWFEYKRDEALND